MMICLHSRLSLQATQIHVLINREKFHTVLDSGAELSLIHTRVCNSLKEKPKLKEGSAFLQSVKGDSFDRDGCA